MQLNIEKMQKLAIWVMSFFSYQQYLFNETWKMQKHTDTTMALALQAWQLFHSSHSYFSIQEAMLI